MPSWFQLVVTLVSAIALEAWIAFSVGAVVAYTESSNMYVKENKKISIEINRM